MGGNQSQPLEPKQPEDLYEFRKLTSRPDTVEIPERAENRRPTDRNFIFAFGLTILLLLPFLIYTLVYSDIRRLTTEYDSCGNFCGERNEKWSGISCSGQDFTDAPYTQYDKDISLHLNTRLIQRQCVNSCPSDYVKTFDICYRPNGLSGSLHEDEKADEFVKETLDYLAKSWWKIVLAIIIATGLSLGAFLVLRYATGVFVWSVIIFSTSLLVLLTCGSWYAYSHAKEESKKHMMVIAVICSIFCIGALILLVVLFKRIKLVILLYKETMKAIFAMPCLMLIPAVTAWLKLIVLAIAITTTLFMLTSGTLQQISFDIYDYKPNGVMTFTIVFSWLVTLWVIQFIHGCQYMVIAGAVASWYFAKNKRYLESPITTALSILARFHLGTVAFGSLIITLVTAIRILLESLTKNDKTREIVRLCMSCIEDIVKFLSKQAYIETAINGQSFYQSGKRACKLLLANAVDLVAVNSVGDFFLAMTQIILIIISTGIAYCLFMDAKIPGIPTAFAFILIVLVVSFTFAVLETTVDTIFICFCEDKQLNDGISRPYFMSRELMQFVDGAKKFSPKDK